MKAAKSRSSSGSRAGAASSLERVFSWLFGGLIGLALLKFGNPVVMAKFVDPPTNVYQYLFYLWPVSWAYMFLVLVAICGLPLIRPVRGVPMWLVWMPAAWLLWQALASTRSIDPGLSWNTVVHFATCVASFYLGLLVLGRRGLSRGFWVSIIVAFGVVLAVGWQQHFGGLEATREYFYLYIYPQMDEVAPEHLRKIDSDRIFSTLFYPNTLAGAILLFLPVVGRVVWDGSAKWLTPAARRFLVGLIGIAALGCLYWSGSKSGWLIMLFVGLVAVLHMGFARRMKLALVAFALVIGLAGFFVKYASFFRQGAASVGARFDYWEAGLKITGGSPVFGTGPGTFGKAYEKIKRPESEMARLAHNDYLQQATDSGLPGFLLYVAFIVGAMAWVYWSGGVRGAPLKLAMWLGLLGWSLQGLAEFGLYIPALAWPAFAFLGWLLAGNSKAIDKPAAAP